MSGEEKRIQALFHEIKVQDDEFAPPFARTWNMVEAKFGPDCRQQTFLKVALTFPRLITAALIIGFLVTAIVIRPWRLPRQPVKDNLVSTKIPGQAFEAGVKPTSEAGTSRRPKSQKRNERNTVVHRFTGRKPVARSNYRQFRQVELSRWQSPTAGLLRSPGDELLRTGPKVIQSAPDMRTFLANLN